MRISTTALTIALLSLSAGAFASSSKTVDQHISLGDKYVETTGSVQVLPPDSRLKNILKSNEPRELLEEQNSVARESSSAPTTVVEVTGALRNVPKVPGSVDGSAAEYVPTPAPVLSTLAQAAQAGINPLGSDTEQQLPEIALSSEEPTTDSPSEQVTHEEKSETDRHPALVFIDKHSSELIQGAMGLAVGLLLLIGLRRIRG